MVFLSVRGGRGAPFRFGTSQGPSWDGLFCQCKVVGAPHFVLVQVRGVPWLAFFAHAGSSGRPISLWSKPGALLGLPFVHMQGRLGVPFRFGPSQSPPETLLRPCGVVGAPNFVLVQAGGLPGLSIFAHAGSAKRPISFWSNPGAFLGWPFLPMQASLGAPFRFGPSQGPF